MVESISKNLTKLNGIKSFDAAHIIEREDGETIQKTRRMSLDTLGKTFANSSSSLEGKVQSKTHSVDEPNIFFKDQLMAMNPEELRAIDKKLAEIKKDPLEPNYIIRVQNLIGKILAQLIRIAEKERVNKEEQKTKYTNSNKEWGNLSREMGDRGFKFVWVTAGLMVANLFAPKRDQDIINFLAREGCRGLADMLNGTTQSKQKMVEGLSQLAMSSINEAANKSSEGNKEQLLRLLDEILQSLKQAARAG